MKRNVLAAFLVLVLPVTGLWLALTNPAKAVIAPFPMTPPPLAVTAAPIASPTPPPTPSPTPSPTPRSLLAGLWDNPNGAQPPKNQIAAFETAYGVHVAIDMHYETWSATFPSADEAADLTAGRIPLVSVGCAFTDAQVAAGTEDPLIDAKAGAMAAYGAPILMRYKWEFNLPYAANNRGACADPSVDVNPPGYFDPATFIAAYRHIHDRFVADGATNVLFVWCPAAHSQQPGAPYWPGDDVVDWVGFDSYAGGNESFASAIASGYRAFSVLGSGAHPVIVAETGTTGAAQATYLTSSSRAAIAAEFPLLQAVVYFNAAGPDNNWTLSPAGAAAFAGFVGGGQ